MIIEPGAFRTNFAGTSLKESSVELGDYEKTAGTRRIRNDHTDGTQQGDPDEAGRVLVDLVHSGRCPCASSSEAMPRLTANRGLQLALMNIRHGK